MSEPFQITFHGLEPSASLEERARERAEKLLGHHGACTGCRVAVHAPPRHHHKRGRYEVRIEIALRGEDLVVSHDGRLDHAHEDAFVALRDAFDAAERRLEGRLRSRRDRARAAS